jgi:hypothetical protein
VATVCHLTTGFVSPQFHVVFDDQFHTVYGHGEKNLITVPSAIYYGNLIRNFMLKTSMAQMDH